MSYKFFYFAYALNLFYYVPNLLASPVVGGVEDRHNLYKYHVSIKYRLDQRNPNSGKLLCGGAIIHDRYVLSAAHCFMIKRNGRIESIIPPRNSGIVVLAGTRETRGSGIITAVHTVFIPIAHNQGQETFGDIAVAKLAANLNVENNRDKLEIILLDPGRSFTDYENKNAFVPGNGCDELYRGDDGLLRSQPNRTAAIRQILEVHMLARSRVPYYFAHSIWALNLDRSEIRACAKGDSGSPLIYANSVIGVLNRSPTIFSRDEMNVMIFTRVMRFIFFIRNAMNEDGDHSQMYDLDA